MLISLLFVIAVWLGLGYGIYRLLLHITAQEPMEQRNVKEYWYMAVFFGPIILISSGYLCMADLVNSWRSK